MRSLITLSIVASLLCLVSPLNARADVVVIVHPENPVRSMTPRQVSDLYLGRTRGFGTGDYKGTLWSAVYEHPVNSPLRETFFHSLNGMPIHQINAYWARLRFSGEVLPPMVLADSNSVLEAVSHNRNAIGYIDSAAVSDSVRVVLRLKE